MATDLTPYLGFDGQCEEAFKRYEKVLGGKILAMMRYSEAPPGSGVPQNPDTANRIMHARLKVGDRTLMGGDGPQGRQPQGFCVAITLDEPGEADRIFKALAEGGTVSMPIGETFWAHRFGMLTDKFGIPWMVNCEKT
ncbi:MAG TPA: VOC family protein [Stellaceae bacterium]|nr:VOC family protein [Stellaceae bacterium]